MSGNFQIPNNASALAGLAVADASTLTLATAPQTLSLLSPTQALSVYSDSVRTASASQKSNRKTLADKKHQKTAATNVKPSLAKPATQPPGSSKGPTLISSAPYQHSTCLLHVGAIDALIVKFREHLLLKAPQEPEFRQKVSFVRNHIAVYALNCRLEYDEMFAHSAHVEALWSQHTGALYSEGAVKRTFTAFFKAYFMCDKDLQGYASSFNRGKH